MQPSSIKYLKHQQINRSRWDACIDAADNGLIYAYSFYLDAMAEEWDALVLNDYEALMPLPRRKKFGIHYIYQPFLTAQLGLFGKSVHDELLKQFLQHIPAKFFYWDFPLNYANLSAPGYQLNERMNFVLDLSPGYDLLSKNYRGNIRRNVRKAKSYGCTIKNNVAVEEVIALAKEQNRQQPVQDFKNFEKVYHHFANNNRAKCYGVYSDKMLVASAAFLFSHQRAYYILVGNHPNGRTMGASHALIDAFIADHAGRKLLLDFEGSDLRNLAFFYSSFGARPQPYASIRLNKFPWWLRWLKK